MDRGAIRVLTDILFPGGALRLSTALAIGAFGAVAITRGARAPLLAMVAWLVGYEAVFEATAYAFGHDATLGAFHAFFWVVAGLIVVPYAWRRGVRPESRLTVAAAAVFAVWALTGFHVNMHTVVGFDPVAELLNETSKTLWAAAYFVPLVRSGDGLPEADADGSAGDAASADLRA
jgi:hypothetical protein